MLRRLGMIAAVAALAVTATACAPPRVGFDPVVAAGISDQVAAVEDRYLEVKPLVERLVLPFLRPATAAKIRAGMAAIEKGFVAARLATSPEAAELVLDTIRHDTEAIASLLPAPG